MTLKGQVKAETSTLPVPLLKVSDLTVQILMERNFYTAVDHIDFSIQRGETLALVGESGCGKSLTALSLLGLLPTGGRFLCEGSIQYHGQELLSLPEEEKRRLRGNRIGMIFQDPSSALHPLYTIRDQLKEVLEYHTEETEEEMESHLIQALNEMGLPDPVRILNTYPHTLSGGMVQRVMIAMALLCQPDLLIADEPTTALDVTLQAQVLAWMRHAQRERGMALLLITHDLGVVEEMADRVLVMYAGDVIERGTVEEVLNRPSHPYTQGLLRSRPNGMRRKQRLEPIKGNVPPLNHYPPGCRFHPRCPYAFAPCFMGKVPDFLTPEPGHTARCWLLALPTQETVENSERST